MGLCGGPSECCVTVVTGKLDDALNQHSVSIRTEFSGHAFAVHVEER